MSDADVVLHTSNLKKTFTFKKKKVEAVRGVDLTVKKGQIFGFLGPNGAGKTTTLRMLATLLSIDEGEAMVAGYDVRKQPREVRKHVGYVSQAGGADDEATGRQDMLLQGRLYGMSESRANKRANELIKLLELGEFIDRKIITYSGGQRRRLDIAIGIMHKPTLLFLDEPTTGLDPQNRANLWNQVKKLSDEGTTIFLTTHYLEEADILSDYVAIMDNGKVVAEGTPRELKKQIAGDSILIKPKASGSDIEKVKKYLLPESYIKEVTIEGEVLHLYVDDGANTLPKIFNLLEGKKVSIDTVSLSEPSLDDVFLKKTGRSLRDGEGKGGRK
jgi:ABC-2 type transport system ATP-binding protein